MNKVEIKYHIAGKTYTQSANPDCQLASHEGNKISVGDLRMINNTLFYAKYIRRKMGFWNKYRIVSWAIYNLPDNEIKKQAFIINFFNSLNEQEKPCLDKGRFFI